MLVIVSDWKLNRIVWVLVSCEISSGIKMLREFLDIEVTGDVSIDADDLKNIIRDRNKYHGSLIKQTMEIKRLTTSVTALDNIIKDIRQSAFVKKTSEPIDLRGISECILKGSAIDESC